MSGYALNMLMKRDLCATISNPSGYAIVRKNGQSNCAPKVTVVVKYHHESNCTKSGGRHNP